MKPKDLVFAGLSIALLTISALFTIPLGPIPITLQVAVVLLIVLIDTPGQALGALGFYILMGAIGLPVFSGGRGGVGVLLGPTGGFLYGFLLGAAVAFALQALILRRVTKQAQQPAGRVVPHVAVDIVMLATVVVVMYACGWLQLMLVMGLSPSAAFTAAVVPFIVPDVIKAALVLVVVRPLRKALAVER